MAVTNRRASAKAGGIDVEQPRKRSFMLTVRTSALLAYYAQAHHLMESHVVEQALMAHLKGYRVYTPAELRGKDEAVA